MTRTTKTLLAGGAAVLVLAGIAGAGVASPRGWNCGPGGFGPAGYGPPGGMPGPMQGRAFERFDANGDGKLTQAEVDQVQGERFATFDADGDGRLTLEEYQALWLETARPAMVDRFQDQDDDGDGVVTTEEFGERSQSLVQRFDRNGNGEISQTDMRPGGRGGWWDDDDDQGDD